MRILNQANHIAERVDDRRDLDVTTDLLYVIARRRAAVKQVPIRIFDVGHAPIRDGIVPNGDGADVRIEAKFEPANFESKLKRFVEIRLYAEGGGVPLLGSVKIGCMVDDGSQT
jgi:hypothetical protein